MRDFGILVSDDAAMCQGFLAMKYWAHLIRKAICLRLLKPDLGRYRRFLEEQLDELLEVYRRDKAVAADGHSAKPAGDHALANLDHIDILTHEGNTERLTLQ